MLLNERTDHPAPVDIVGNAPIHAPQWQTLAALVELTDSVLRADSSETAFRTLAAGLKQCWECEYAALATLHDDRFRIEVFTHLDAFDSGAEIVRTLEDVCGNYHESLVETKTSQIVEIDPGVSIAIIPFPAIDGKILAVGILRSLTATTFLEPRISLSIFGEHLGPVLETKLSVLKRSRFQNFRKIVRGKLAKNKRWLQVAMLVGCVTALIPLPYRVRCDAELQPVVRRHIAAPFDGIFQQSFVKPGDIVAAGQALGRLDPKELTWEIAAAAAERDRAAKSCDVNLAAGKTAAAQIDRLESRRLTERLKLLENRLAHLDVTAPIAGVVVSGDLERAEGAPVKIGQSLFEVAPLDRMVVDVLVPEAEIDRVRTGQEIRLYLDSVPSESLGGAVSRIYPRAELRGGANVFIAEVTLDNAAGLLRPGMKGTVDIRTLRRPLIWIAAHRLNEAFWRFIR